MKKKINSNLFRVFVVSNSMCSKLDTKASTSITMHFASREKAMR